MSNIGNTSPMQAEHLDTIVDRLNGTVAKVSKLRLSLEELEAELVDIRQQCENAIRAPISVTSVNKARDAPMTRVKMPHSPVSLANRSKIGMSKKLEPKSNFAKEIPALSLKTQSKGHSTSFRIPRLFSRVSVGRGSSTGIAIEKGSDLPDSSYQFRTVVEEPEVQGGGALVPSCRHVENSLVAEQIRDTHPPCPTTNPFPNTDPSRYPPELKHEGDAWFVLFNSSPKVKRVLNVNLVHDLGYESWVTCVRFSRDGKWLATGRLGTTKLYDVKTGVETCVFNHTQDVCIRSVCFSPDGRYLATGGNDNRIRIAEKQIHRTFKGHKRGVNSVDFSPNSQFIVSGSDDGSVRIWSVHSKALKVLTIEDHYLADDDHRVRSAAISPDGRYVAVGSWDMVVSIWEVHTGVLLQRLRGHGYAVNSVAFTPDGKGLISGSSDCMLKYWDMSGLNIGSGAGTALTSTSSTSPSPCLMNLTGHTSGVSSVAVSHDGTWLVSGSDDGKVLFWDMRTGVAQYMLAAHKGVVYVGLSPVENVFATVGWDQRVRIWSYGIRG